MTFIRWKKCDNSHLFVGKNVNRREFAARIDTNEPTSIAKTRGLMTNFPLFAIGNLDTHLQG